MKLAGFLLDCWKITGKRHHNVNLKSIYTYTRIIIFLLVLFSFKMNQNLEAEEKELSSYSHKSKSISTYFNSSMATETSGKT